jgi:hypothetical protein
MYSGGRTDPYQPKKKLPDPTRCPSCGAVFAKGRWTWKSADDGANEELCPACKRIKDRVPAGVIQLKGEFFDEHRDEIENLIQNQERLEKERHPLERLMALRRNGDSMRVETTGLRLARRVGDALQDAYQGDLKIDYLKGQDKVRVNWER